MTQRTKVFSLALMHVRDILKSLYLLQKRVEKIVHIHKDCHPWLHSDGCFTVKVTESTKSKKKT